MKLEQKLLKIATTHSYAMEQRGDFKERMNDSEDFIETSVWSLQKMLEEAYELGRKEGKKHEH